MSDMDITLGTALLSFTQESDCCDSESTICQEITIERHDGGGGAFYTLATHRWAFDDAEQLRRFVDKAISAMDGAA